MTHGSAPARPRQTHRGGRCAAALIGDHFGVVPYPRPATLPAGPGWRQWTQGSKAQSVPTPTDRVPDCSREEHATDTRQPVLTPVEVISRAEQLRASAVTLIRRSESAEQSARATYDAARQRIVDEQLSRMPVDMLEQASEGRLRLNMVRSAGIRTVAQVRASGSYGLRRIDGIGERTSEQLMAAVRQVETALRDEARVRFDVDTRPEEHSALLNALRAHEAALDHIEPMRPELDELKRRIDARVDIARLESRPIRRLFVGSRRRESARFAFVEILSLVSDPAISSLDTRMNAARTALSQLSDGREDIWADYTARPVAYNGLLIEIGGLEPETDASQGFAPADIVDRIRECDLDTSLLNVSLRGYQAFGAKFALVQERTILGDEMGLGKTIEALAVLCHLHVHGATHFLVVSPASVFVNWQHEIRRHTRLDSPWLLHGVDRDQLTRRWAREGGVAITTFDTLGKLPLSDISIAALVVDEAHYVKNPHTNRARATRSTLGQSVLALLMSGTPMENRVEEFRTLVRHIQPELASTIRANTGLAGADVFRRKVAPIYLRRNQVDVLSELPEKIETEEWLRLEGASAAQYRRAVANRNFMEMRQAAYLTANPQHSAKLTRLLEIVEEATDNDRKVVVYSFFLKVIERIHAALGPLAVGPLTGRVPAGDRQQLVDDFSDRREPAVLVSQIKAGGVGLNIQAASVVILTEPQWNPATEEQAIARCHRMGQVRPVEVHRLLTEDSVDEHMRRVLNERRTLFDEFVRRSELRDVAPEAIDVTDDWSTQEVASWAEQERQIIERERRRLRLEE